MSITYPEITWNDDYNTGVQVIDEQHMILVSLINETSEKLYSENSQALLLQITQDLLAYALYHFETEEALMQQYHYQQADEFTMQRHLKEHRSFSDQVLAVREKLQAGVKVERSELISFLTQWLINHILKTDKALAKQVIAMCGSPLNR